MTFIPTNPQIGDRVRLTRDVTVISGTYTKGHEFVITGFSDRGIMLKDNEGRNLTEVHPALFDGELPYEKM